MTQSKKITRRRFLLLTGGAVGAAALTCGGLAAWGIQQPEVELRQLNCGEKTKMDKILVAYASRCGSTGEVAEVIGQTLCSNSWFGQILGRNQKMR
jgi:menaquinone-dependent protoporphyrinogen oxidase